MRVMVTGGAGFIGSALVRHLVLDKGYEVLNVDELTYAGNLASLRTVEDKPNYRFLKADICDRAAMDEALAEFRPDRVMHLAAESHVDRSITGAADFVQTNIIGTFTLLEAALAYWKALDGAAREDASASSTSRPTRSTARSATRACSPRTRPTIRARLIRRRRRRPTISPRPGSGPTACRSWSRTARTITGPIIFPKS